MNCTRGEALGREAKNRSWEALNTSASSPPGNSPWYSRAYPPSFADVVDPSKTPNSAAYIVITNRIPSCLGQKSDSYIAGARSVCWRANSSVFTGSPSHCNHARFTRAMLFLQCANTFFQENYKIQFDKFWYPARFRTDLP